MDRMPAAAIASLARRRTVRCLVLSRLVCRKQRVWMRLVPAKMNDEVRVLLGGRHLVLALWKIERYTERRSSTRSALELDGLSAHDWGSSRACDNARKSFRALPGEHSTIQALLVSTPDRSGICSFSPVPVRSAPRASGT